MTDPTPLVTASRDALARELFLVDFPDRTQAEYVWAELADDLLPKRTYLRKADTLLASGVVRAVDGLAKDERTTVAKALAAWERSGPTSLTVALMADALYGVAALGDAMVDVARQWCTLHDIHQDDPGHAYSAECENHMRESTFAEDLALAAALATPTDPSEA